MSNFDGHVREFPEIRVDYFRLPKTAPPVLACFLSHVHSDHLQGLLEFKGPFIYCSAATRAILLRLKTVASRLAFDKGIVENPRTQTYRHLEKLLRPIPLDTPTVLELQKGLSIRVTLLDANHCTGAVMFLFEGNGKAALYTGDIRSEPRMVSALTQNPCMLEYSLGSKTLDCIYLDTSVLNDYPLPTKAEGLRELLEKVSKYPRDTVFHFHAWTYGYEEVWIALSKALDSKIHVDEYKMDVYNSLAPKAANQQGAQTAQNHLAAEAPYLVGFTVGNKHHEGCLTRDEDVRIHSCEKGTRCSAMENGPVVRIQPIITHHDKGRDVMEVGLDGAEEAVIRFPYARHSSLPELRQLVGALRPKDIWPCTFSPAHWYEKGWSIRGLFEDCCSGNSYTLDRMMESTIDIVWQLDLAPDQTAEYIDLTFRNAFGKNDPVGDHIRVFTSISATAASVEQDLPFPRIAVGSSPPPSEVAPQSPSTPPPREGKGSVSPPLQRKRDFQAFSEDGSTVENSAEDDDDGPDLLGDSQASTISDAAYARRRRAFRDARSSLRGERWDGISLISTLDHHSTLDVELGEPWRA
ncbi:beta-lactamase-like protein [Xylariaceae sp. FL0804]|nr:beta-lactamase-like protein [Xylariaceae sp. FL0804]